MQKIMPDIPIFSLSYHVFHIHCPAASPAAEVPGPKLLSAMQCNPALSRANVQCMQGSAYPDLVQQQLCAQHCNSAWSSSSSMQSAPMEPTLEPAMTRGSSPCSRSAFTTPWQAQTNIAYAVRQSGPHGQCAGQTHPDQKSAPLQAGRECPLHVQGHNWPRLIAQSHA